MREGIEYLDNIEGLTFNMSWYAYARNPSFINTIGSSWYHIVWHPEIEE